MLNKREIAKLAKEIKSLKAALRGSTTRRASNHELEIFDFLGSNADLEKASNKVWPDVNYKGQNIVDFIVEYSNKIRRKFENPASEVDGGYTWMQECYGGYDIKSDTYYMGFDVSKIFEGPIWNVDENDDGDFEYGIEEVPGWALFKIKNGKFDLYLDGEGNFYNSGYRQVKSMRIADLRLD